MSKAHPKRRWLALPKEELDGVKTNEADAASTLRRKVAFGQVMPRKKQEPELPLDAPNKTTSIKERKEKKKDNPTVEQSKFPVMEFAFKKFLERK